MTEYEMSGKPYSQKSGLKNHTNERISRYNVSTFYDQVMIPSVLQLVILQNKILLYVAPQLTNWVWEVKLGFSSFISLQLYQNFMKYEKCWMGGVELRIKMRMKRFCRIICPLLFNLPAGQTLCTSSQKLYDIDFSKCRREITASLNDFSNRWCKRENVEPDALKEWKINIFKIIDTRISFYSRNTHLLPPKSNSSFRHLKRGIQDFHMNYVLVPADKTANNVVVVWRLYYINTLKRQLVDTYAYKLQPSLSERVIVDGHGCHTALHFGVKAKENQDKVPTLYWLPKLHKKPYKARFIANSSSCTTTELSKLLTSCLTAVKKHVIKYCEKVYERSAKNLFWSIKNSGEILDKLKARDFNATSLSTYDFSTLNTTLPHNLIKDKLINLIERIFKREGSPYLACNDRNAFFASEEPKK